MGSPVHCYCPSCKHRGKCIPRDGSHGVCVRCGAARVPGVPTTGQPAGRPRTSVAERLRRQAAELVALADELELRGKSG